MRVKIVKTGTGFCGVDEKKQRLALMPWSIEKMKPKEGEIWSCNAILYEPLILLCNIEDYLKLYPSEINSLRFKLIKEQYNNV